MLAYANASYQRDPIQDFVGSPYYLDSLPQAPDGRLQVSLIGHVDSAPMQVSTKLSITPLQLAIAELPPAIRMSLRCMLLASFCISMSSKEVKYEKIFDHFKEELALVQDMTVRSGDREFRLCVRLALMTSDLVAKAELLGKPVAVDGI